MPPGIPVLLDRTTGQPRKIPILAPPSISPPEPHGALLVLHPGYGAASNVIFSLPCVDRYERPRVDSSDSRRPTVAAPTASSATTASTAGFGVHHRTALVAAQIVANNAVDGFLAHDRQGTQRVSEALEDVLTDRKYFFIVPGDDHYPIVPSFQDWRFPHDSLSSTWPTVPATSSSRQPAQCSVTGFPWALDWAHIVPSMQTAWFDKNGMSRYGRSVYPSIDDDANRLWLRKDMHSSTFDAFRFAFVPKLVASAEETTSSCREVGYVLHILALDQPLFHSFYHDVRLHLHGVAREYLFARFAQAVFIRVEPFVTAHKRRRIARFVLGPRLSEEEVVTEEVDGDELFQMYSGGGRTRSHSPTKRKRDGSNAPLTAEQGGGVGEGGDADHVGEDDSTLGGDVGVDDVDCWGTNASGVDEEEMRGRKRRRTRSRELLLGANC